jgi:GNAT superfamily N-acetyltransferase
MCQDLVDALHQGTEAMAAMIRPFRREDAPSCCSLVRDCLRLDTSLSSALREKMLTAETPQAMEERSRLFYMAVYESEEQVLGVAGLDMNEIRLLFAAPGYQRSGVGRTLLEHIIAMVPGHLFPDIFVYAALPSVPFYRSQGFVEKGHVAFSLGGESLETVFMTLRISR